MSLAVGFLSYSKLGETFLCFLFNINIKKYKISYVIILVHLLISSFLTNIKLLNIQFNKIVCTSLIAIDLICFDIRIHSIHTYT